jgi:tetratricopeptide (TPR) repeat protein
MKRATIYNLSLYFFGILVIAFPAFSAPSPQLQSPSSAPDRAQLKAMRVQGLQCIERGSLMEADSLLSMADSAGLLDAVDVVKWLPVKAVLKRYSDAGRLCCRAGEKEPMLAYFACNNLYEIIKDQPVETKRAALAAYGRCALSQKGCDTLQIRQWLSHAYGSFALFTEETDLVRELDSRHFPTAGVFLAMARDRFAQGFFSPAVVPAMEAYRRCDAAPEKSLAATIVYQCYVRLGKTDDAALWLSRASLSDTRFRAQAIAFLQDAGYLDKADSLMATLPAGLARDTLALRRALRSGSVPRARELAQGIKDRDAALAWKVRTAVFSGNGADLDGWIDTVSFKPGWEYAREMLGYRYKLEVLKDAPSAYQDFGALEYAIWLNQPIKAAALPFSGYPPAARQMLVCELVSALCEKKLLAEAQKAATQVPSGEAGPELQYYCGDILIRQGSVPEGAKILEQLVLAHPEDVFSLKAKVILKNLKR